MRTCEGIGVHTADSRQTTSALAAVGASTAQRATTWLTIRLAPLLLLLALTTLLQAQFNYTTSGGGVTITGYTGPGGDVIIPDSLDGLPVTGIGADAFSRCATLTGVIIPDSVTSIGSGAFFSCTGLNSVTLPDGVTRVPQSAFESCTSLTSVTMSDQVTSIGDWAFWNCSSLRSITIPDNLTSIGDGAFRLCAGLRSITIPGRLTSIGDRAFWLCNSLSFKITSDVTSISGLRLNSVTALTAIEVDLLNPVYSSVDGVLYDRSQTTLILYPRGRGGSVIVPSSVTSIGPEAFKDCLNLQAVYFLGDAPAAQGRTPFASTSATLFYTTGSSSWESAQFGRPVVPWNGLFGAHSLELHAGLTITGEIGETYAIDYVTDLADPAESDWRCLEYLQVPASPYLWTDRSSPATGRRFYRAVAMEPPENMVFIPPGSFRMGSLKNEVGRSEEDGPQTEVIIRRGFWMGKYEVTQGEYEAVMGNNPSQFKGDPNRPVEQVSWFNARDYCVKLTERERLAGRIAPNSLYRLPTEAEWEYACRAGTSTRFSYGDDPGLTDFADYAWYGPNSDGQTHPVGQKLPNRWGLYDMHGNVKEWCQDWHAKALPGGRVVDPQGPATGSARVIRGGGSYRNHLIASFCRSSTRYAHDSPGTYGPGFRVVLVPVQP